MARNEKVSIKVNAGKLKGFLASRNMSVREASRACGVSEKTIRNIISCRRVTLDNAVKMCRAFMVTTEDLFGNGATSEVLEIRSIFTYDPPEKEGF